MKQEAATFTCGSLWLMHPKSHVKAVALFEASEVDKILHPGVLLSQQETRYQEMTSSGEYYISFVSVVKS